MSTFVAILSRVESNSKRPRYRPYFLIALTTFIIFVLAGTVYGRTNLNRTKPTPNPVQVRPNIHLVRRPPPPLWRVWLSRVGPWVRGALWGAALSVDGYYNGRLNEEFVEGLRQPFARRHYNLKSWLLRSIYRLKLDPFRQYDPEFSELETFVANIEQACDRPWFSLEYRSLSCHLIDLENIREGNLYEHAEQVLTLVKSLDPDPAKFDIWDLFAAHPDPKQFTMKGFADYPSVDVVSEWLAQFQMERVDRITPHTHNVQNSVKGAQGNDPLSQDENPSDEELDEQFPEMVSVVEAAWNRLQPIYQTGQMWFAESAFPSFRLDHPQRIFSREDLQVLERDLDSKIGDIFQTATHPENQFKPVRINIFHDPFSIEPETLEAFRRYYQNPTLELDDFYRFDPSAVYREQSPEFEEWLEMIGGSEVAETLGLAGAAGLTGVLENGRRIYMGVLDSARDPAIMHEISHILEYAQFAAQFKRWTDILERIQIGEEENNFLSLVSEVRAYTEGAAPWPGKKFN